MIEGLKKKKNVSTVGGRQQRMECGKSVLIKPKMTGKWCKAVANIRTVPMKYDSDIQST